MIRNVELLDGKFAYMNLKNFSACSLKKRYTK